MVNQAVLLLATRWHHVNRKFGHESLTQNIIHD